MIAHFKDVAEMASSDVIRFLARRELRAVHQDHWPQISASLQAEGSEGRARRSRANLCTTCSLECRGRNSSMIGRRRRPGLSG